MERHAQYKLRKYTKEDIIDLLEEHPDLLTTSKEDLTKLAQDNMHPHQVITTDI